MLTLSPLDGPYGPQTNNVKDNLCKSKSKNVVSIDTLRFQLSYLTVLPLKGVYL